jgi:peptidoglycan L-alanyl-D-glutamate endopeptidase CwlK
MNKLSTSSAKCLATCHPLLQECVMEVLENMDVAVTCGTRDKATQNKLFAEKKSKLQWPNSKHNSSPSVAVDLVIYHPQWKYLFGDAAQLAEVATTKGRNPVMVSRWFYAYYARLDMLMVLAAKKRGITLRWGGKWSAEEDFIDNKFMDIFHWEIVNG